MLLYYVTEECNVVTVTGYFGMHHTRNCLSHRIFCNQDGDGGNAHLKASNGTSETNRWCQGGVSHKCPFKELHNLALFCGFIIKPALWQAGDLSRVYPASQSMAARIPTPKNWISKDKQKKMDEWYLIMAGCAKSWEQSINWKDWTGVKFINCTEMMDKAVAIRLC